MLSSLAARRTEDCDAAVVKLLNYFDARVGKATAMFVLITMLLSTILLAAASMPGALSPQEEAFACSDERPVLESQPETAWEGPQSLEPELFTPID